MSYKVVNPEDVTNICDAIDGIPTCNQLVEYAEFQARMWAKQQQKLIEAKIKAARKKIPPTDLASVINWIAIQIEEAEKVFEDTTAGIAEVTTAWATISAKISSKASEMSCGTIPIPPLPGA